MFVRPTGGRAVIIRHRAASVGSRCSNSSSQRQTDGTLDLLMELEINGRTISVRFKSDAVVAQRVAAHIQRRIEEDDWLPFQSKEDALQSWQRLGGIRLQVLRAYDLI